MAAGSYSLNVRLLAVTGCLLVVAFAATILTLDFAFRRSAEQAARSLLEAQIYALIGAAVPDASGQIALPAFQLEPRLLQPGSGLYAEIRDGDGTVLWRSPSAVGLELGRGIVLEAGRRYFGRHELGPEAGEALVAGLGIRWELDGDLQPSFRLFAAEDLAAYRSQLGTFRRQLTGWFGAVMLVLMGALWLALRAGLQPLRQMRTEIRAIEGGTRESLSGNYPRELEGVAHGLNALLLAERSRMQRYRDSMADLAHSLKTPLAVLRTEVEAAVPDPATLRAQLARMQTAIDYQLRRAAATGPRTLSGRPLPLLPVAREIVAGLQRLHAARPVDCRVEIDAGCSYPLESGDLYELLGNLLDNAWKWARASVVLRATGGPAEGLRITVADDGPGIPAQERSRVLARGQRADSRAGQPGQGIGLAVVDEIVRLYHGELQIDAAEAGGARITVRLPPAPGA